MKIFKRIAIAANFPPMSKILMIAPLHAIICCVFILYLTTRYSVGDWIPVLILSLAQRGAIKKAEKKVAVATPQAHHIYIL